MIVFVSLGNTVYSIKNCGLGESEGNALLFSVLRPLLKKYGGVCIVCDAKSVVH
ncbi:MAG: hypothetical protein HCA25_07500 [Dolichospermum sp. DET50]|nr:hypothetical protein [Dolichospermum sp. DET66]MBS3032131.1 hypothetical protein [Dolichospermum sp. DET67]MBS3037335.1 hypothetical protein [Dolichospermum sp. DET50]QSX69324.1 MAG: hypothetical protein EZY12_06720 [Dolichospermum sp. DET69]